MPHCLRAPTPPALLISVSHTTVQIVLVGPGNRTTYQPPPLPPPPLLTPDPPPPSLPHNLQIVLVGPGDRTTFEPGPNRSIDLSSMLASHFGSGGASSPWSSNPNPNPQGGVGSPAAQRPLCALTCYWGVDDTPVVIGMVEDAGTAAEGQPQDNGHIGKLQSELSGMQAQVWFPTRHI